MVNLHTHIGTSGATTIAIFKDAETDARGAGHVHRENDQLDQYRARFRMVAGTTSPITFKVRGGTTSGGQVTMNGGPGGAAKFGGALISSLKVTELRP